MPVKVRNENDGCQDKSAQKAEKQCIDYPIAVKYTISVDFFV